MTRLPPDCLVFKTANGESIPCSASDVTIELIGESAALIDETLLQNAAAAVLRYFKDELGRTSVSVGEFSQALEKALRSLGLNVQSADAPAPELRVAEADLLQLAGESGEAFELTFFTRLRDELRRGLRQSPQVVRFSGLRGCVKQLTGARRWSGRCQTLHDHIVEYLRTCLSVENNGAHCALLVH
jgi:hypothetical protein